MRNAAKGFSPHFNLNDKRVPDPVEFFQLNDRVHVYYNGAKVHEAEDGVRARAWAWDNLR